MQMKYKTKLTVSKLVVTLRTRYSMLRILYAYQLFCSTHKQIAPLV